MEFPAYKLEKIPVTQAMIDAIGATPSEAFYEKKNLDPQMHVQQENNNATVADEVDPELLAKILANPEMRALLNSLAKTMK